MLDSICLHQTLIQDLDLKNTHTQLGYVQGVFGIKGWFKVFSFCRPKQQILDYPNWQLRQATKTSNLNKDQIIDQNIFDQVCVLEQGKEHGNAVVAKIAGIDTRTQAEALVGTEIWVETAILLDHADGEYYWFQLVGLNVVTAEGKELGVVTSLIETGANDVLVVRDKHSSSAGKKQEVLIPYLPDNVVKQVDLEQQQIVVEWQTDYD